MSLLDDLIDDSFDEVDDLPKEKVFAFDCVRSNPYLFGHEKQEELFLKLFNKNELPHAWILSGPKGIGKETFAFRLAKFLFSRKEAEAESLFGAPEPITTLDADMNQPAVQRVISKGHADLLYIEDGDGAKGDIKIDKIREVVSFLRKTSAEGGWRIVIINNAEKMNTESQNALLKILEEPPQKTLLVLVTTTVSRLLPTILSRSRVLTFQSLTDSDMRKIFNLDPNPLEDVEQREILLRLSKGSFGKFQSLADGEAMESFKLLIKGLQNFPDVSRKDMQDISDVLSSDKTKVYGFIEMACWWIETIIHALSLEKEHHLLLDEEKAFLENLGGQKSISSLLNLRDRLKILQSDMEWAHPDLKTVVMSVFLYFENYKTLENQ